jgi:CBS domain-containing protein
LDAAGRIPICTPAGILAQRPKSQEAVVLIAEVLRTKGSDVVRIHAADSVALAVCKLAEHRIGALVVEDRWLKPIGIFSERDFINAIARDGAAVLGFR